MVERAEKLQALEALPEFDSYPLASNPSWPPREVPVYHVARFTYSGRPEEVVYVVGKSKSPQGEVYGSTDGKFASDGKLLAVGNEAARAVEIDLIEMYEVLIGHDELTDAQAVRLF